MEVDEAELLSCRVSDWERWIVCFCLLREKSFCFLGLSFIADAAGTPSVMGIVMFLGTDSRRPELISPEKKNMRTLRGLFLSSSCSDAINFILNAEQRGPGSYTKLREGKREKSHCLPTLAEWLTKSRRDPLNHRWGKRSFLLSKWPWLHLSPS